MACNQTAVAILQELCVKRKWNPPMYEEIYSGGTSNEPVFHISVTLCNGVKAIGMGRQKKAAKHDAAKKALDELNNSMQALTYKEQSPAKAAGPSSPMNPHEDFSGNAVGELSEMCNTYHLPAPEFTLIGDEGEPHQKTFTFRCTVASRQEKGVARKKQTAKHLAAVEMIKTLKTNFKDFLSQPAKDPKIVKPEISEEMEAEDRLAIEKYLDLKRDQILIPSFDHGLKISEYHLAFKEKLINLKDILANPSVGSEKNPIKKVQLVADALNQKISVTLTAGKDGSHIAFLLMDTVPSAVQSGIGQNETEAQRLAAHAMLEFLMVMAG